MREKRSDLNPKEQLLWMILAQALRFKYTRIAYEMSEMWMNQMKRIRETGRNCSTMGERAGMEVNLDTYLL